MIQAVQQYQDAIAAAEEVYSQAANTRQAAVEAAWTALGESDNAFVRFAVENAGNYKREVVAILGALPENPNAGDVRRAAEQANLGGSTEVDRAIRAAVEAGVLSDGEAQDAAPARGGEARRRFLERVRAQVGAHAVGDVESAINEILDEEAEGHAARRAQH